MLTVQANFIMSLPQVYIMKIIISDNMEKEVVEKISCLGNVVYQPADLKNALLDAEVLIVRSATKVTKELIDAGKRLRVVARAGIGLDNVDSDYCKEKGIVVINTPGASTNAVAELTIGIMIAAVRNVQRAHHEMKSGIWGKKNLTGCEIEGKTLGIIGYGRIGKAVGDKARALGMRIIAYNPPPRQEDGIIEYVGELEEFLPGCDVITLHCVLVEETRKIINRKTIAKMKDGVVILNLARGELIDEEALYEACKSGKVKAAALDVYDKEPYTGKLLELDNVYFTPHIGAATKEAQKKIGEELVERVREEMLKE
jgi:D-3-phosphoglycerate dehydrogenase